MRSPGLGGILPAIAAFAAALGSPVLPLASASGGPGAAPAGSFSISPAGHQLLARPALTLDPTSVSNTTRQRLSVRVFPVLLHQLRSGSFTYSTRPAAIRAARRQMAVSAARFGLGGHSNHTVLTRWRAAGPRGSSYVGVMYRASAANPRTPVHTVEQLLAVDLLGAPGRRPASGPVTAVGVSENTDHHLEFRISARNTGQTYGSPREVTLSIARLGGGRVRAVRIPTGVILPGVTRDYSTELPVRLAGGRYRATGSVRFAGHGLSSRGLDFRLDAHGNLPSPSLIPGSLQAEAAAGRAASISVAMHNAGSASGAPRGTASLYPEANGVPASRPIATAPLTGAAIRAGGRAVVRLNLGHDLRGGEYRVVVRYASPATTTQPAVADFRTTASTAWATRALRWFGGHALVIGLIVALVALGGASLRMRLQSRRRAAVS